MTRINCVPVESLIYDHKIAEYKESTRVFNKVIARLEKGKPIPKLDGGYRLSTGHETFFFDKLMYIHKRRAKLYFSLLKKGVKVNKAAYFQISFSLKARLAHTPYWNDWEPTPEDMYINMARLCHRHFKTDLKEFS